MQISALACLVRILYDDMIVKSDSGKTLSVFDLMVRQLQITPTPYVCYGRELNVASLGGGCEMGSVEKETKMPCRALVFT